MDYHPLFLLLAGGALGYGLGYSVARLRALPSRSAVSEDDQPASDARPSGSTTEHVFAIAAELEGLFQQSAYPRDLLQNERFLAGVELMSGPEHSSEMLLDYMVGANVVTACMALEALSRRSDDPTPVTEPILANVAQVHLWSAYFALRVLSVRADEPVIGAVLVRANADWIYPLPANVLREFIILRLTRGEEPRFGSALHTLTDDRAPLVAAVLERLADILPTTLIDEFRSWQGSRVDITLLGSIGRVWPADPEVIGVARSDRLEEAVNELEPLLRAPSPHSIVLVGETGVGKTALIRVLAYRLAADGWMVFEAAAADLMAGQSFIGQLEDRIKSVIGALRGKQVLWIVPNFHDLLWAGRHAQNPQGALDMLLPSIEAGEIRVLGETTPASYERLIQAKPQLRTAFTKAVLPPSGSRETLELARRWAELRQSGDTPLLSETTLREALQLAGQYLNDRAAPGNLLHLLDSTVRRLTSAPTQVSVTIELEDLLVTLSQLSGLPLSILDERRGLDLTGLEAMFRRRVIGQPEAVQCLVERVAMIKAGVNDPSRPIGVFLFVGPTGTGKTEIAKTLASYLFGSPERMIRIDMSELQAPESLERILGGSAEGTAGVQGTALVHAIRRQPFSVILLDEFEKAHPSVWDLFLQVFDDGRLTDRLGNVADLRHAVIIMTSNLGATLPYGATIGFSADHGGFAPAAVERAVAQTFRREFVNRIDRVVVFRPLGRAEMREILRKELDDALQRRGLRNRSWAVEWDASAIDFLLEKGFTPDLGARPLKRAVEQYLLAPLATTIVNHEVPEGDQFLLVRGAGDRLEVLFIDPDAPDEVIPEVRGASLPAELDVRQLVLEAGGAPEEVEVLEARYAALADRIESPEWHARKDEALAAMRAPGFWTSDDRFATLGTAEYMDRIEVGLETAGSLLRRLGQSNRGRRRHYPRDLVRRLAQQIFLLDLAHTALADDLPRDAYLLVRASRDSGTDFARADEFAGRIGGMYRAWAEKRRMRLEVLQEVHGEGPAPYGQLLAVSGFGAHSILHGESGLHVLETPQDEKSFNRVKVRVVVAPQDAMPAGTAREACAQAMHAIERATGSKPPPIVRRYREEPSPLVRDAVRHWRTGRVEQVLGGDFDVIT